MTGNVIPADRTEYHNEWRVWGKAIFIVSLSDLSRPQRPPSSGAVLAVPMWLSMAPHSASHPFTPSSLKASEPVASSLCGLGQGVYKEEGHLCLRGGVFGAGLCSHSRLPSWWNQAQPRPGAAFTNRGEAGYLWHMDRLFLSHSTNSYKLSLGYA